MSKDIIKKDSTSYTQIRKDLLEYVESKPEDEKWKDTFEPGAGMTLLELIAGLGAFNTYHKLMLRKEANLDTAQLKSSITELSFNRGFMLPTYDTLEINLVLQANEEDNFVSMGEAIADGGDFEVYALESKTVSKDEPTTVHCVCGNKQVIKRSMSNITPFSTLSFLFEEKYISRQMESFKVDGEEIPLISDVDYLREYGSNFLIRRTKENEVEIFIGNGVLGWYNETMIESEYTVITFDEETFLRTDNITPLIDAEFIERNILIHPTYGMNKEKIRGISFYYPIDGRIVKNIDYENVIMKFYGSVIKDIYSFNTDPDQEVHIIKTDDFTDNHLDQIKKLVDSKRAAGMKVVYFPKNKEDGKSLNCVLKVRDREYYEDIFNDAKNILDEKLFKFTREKDTLSNTDIAIELSSKLGISFFPLSDEVVELNEEDFLKEISLEIR